MRRPIAIFPEIVQPGEPWAVRDGREGYTDFKAHEIMLPMDFEERDYAAWHELVHVWATPPRAHTKRSGVDHDVLQVVEDLRIETMARRIIPSPPLPSMVLEPRPYMSLRQITGLLVACRSCPEYPSLVASVTDSTKLPTAGITEKDVEIAVRLADIVLGLLTKLGTWGIPYRKSVAASRWLTETLKDLEAKESKGEKRTMFMDFQRPDDDPWGSIQVVDLASLARKSVTTYMAHHKAKEYGQNPSFPWRQMLDGKPFRATRHLARGLGGSLLLDASGSMGENAYPESILAMVKCAPAASIAAYAGYNSGHTRRGNGRLFILVENGKVAPPDKVTPHEWGGENCVDFPALTWLRRQPAPRYWVSDAGVSGRNYDFDSSLKEQCLNYCKVHDIKRMDEPIEVLRDMGVLDEKIKRSVKDAKAEVERVKREAKEKAEASL